jgi:hypothetical protein
MLGLDTPGQPPLPYLSRPQHWLIDTTENKGLGVCPRPSSFKLLLLGGLLEMPLHVALVDAGCAVPIFELTATAWRKHGNAWGCGLDGDGCMSAVIATTGGNRDLPATGVAKLESTLAASIFGKAAALPTAKPEPIPAQHDHCY